VYASADSNWTAMHHRKLIRIPVLPISNALAVLNCKESPANHICEISVETAEILSRKFCFRQSRESELKYSKPELLLLIIIIIIIK
jgi:hypothetical protein